MGSAASTRTRVALKGLHARIGTMIAANPHHHRGDLGTLADEHGATVAYPTLRTYVSSRLPQRRPRPDAS